MPDQKSAAMGSTIIQKRETITTRKGSIMIAFIGPIRLGCYIMNEMSKLRAADNVCLLHSFPEDP